MPVLKDDIAHIRFGLLHHAHTGKRIHRSHTSYPLLAVLLLMVGVLLTALTLQVRAADIMVTAAANGPTPVQAAVILSPEQDDRFTDSNVPVSGTCESGYYIKLFRNEIFSGVALCTPGGTFSILSDLFDGRNDLQARTFNIADNEGPASSIVTVYYDPPDQPINPVTPINPEAPTNQTPKPPLEQKPFYLATEYFFKAAYSGQSINWDFELFGGKGPFTAYVAWGDGYSDVISGLEDSKFRVNHTYKTLKDQREYYSVTIRIVDSSGRTASLQLIAIMNDPNVISGALVKPNDPMPFSPVGWFSGMLKAVWSVYGLVLLMGVCFWLGERRGESMMLLKRRRQRSA